MHSAAESAGNLNIVKFLLTHDIGNPMLLAQWKSPKGKQLLPVDVAENLTVCKYIFQRLTWLHEAVLVVSIEAHCGGGGGDYITVVSYLLIGI